MDISVIICTYAREEFLRKVLVDLARQESAGHVRHEVLVVDNNSPDGTRRVCEEFTSRYPDTFRYVFEERQGKTFALNTGIRASRGNIIAFTDDDVVIDRNWLCSIYRAFSDHRECKAFGGRVLPVWPDTLPPWIAREGAFRNTSGAVVEHDFGDAVKSYSQTGMFPIGANMFFSREIFERHGWFNERLNQEVKHLPMLEDVEFCTRLLKREEAFKYIPDALVYHPVCHERLTKSYIRKHAFKSGRAHYVMNENGTSRLVILALQKNRRKLLNIPFYIIRETLAGLAGYLLALIQRNKQATLYYEKELIYHFGIMYENWAHNLTM